MFYSPSLATQHLHIVLLITTIFVAVQFRDNSALEEILSTVATLDWSYKYGLVQSNITKWSLYSKIS